MHTDEIQLDVKLPTTIEKSGIRMRLLFTNFGAQYY